MSVVIFMAALIALIALAWTVNRIRGVRAHYIEDWRPDQGERILLRDMQADIFVVGINRPRFVTYGRPRRGALIVTDKRIIAGTRTLFRRRRMLEYMIYPRSAPDSYAEMFDGGLFTCGYRTLVFLPRATERILIGRRPYVVLKPSPSTPSSINIDSVRIYSDQAASFPTF